MEALVETVDGAVMESIALVVAHVLQANSLALNEQVSTGQGTLYGPSYGC